MPEIKMKAKYKGTCIECKITVPVNELVFYNTDVKTIKHVKCPRKVNTAHKTPVKESTPKLPADKQGTKPATKQQVIKMPAYCHKCHNPIESGEKVVVTTTLTHVTCPDFAEPPF